MGVQSRIENDAEVLAVWEPTQVSEVLEPDAGLEKSFEDFYRRLAFWELHFAEFAEKYPEQYVAVIDEVVVFTTESLLALLQWADAANLIPNRDFDVEFITARPRSWAW